MYINNVLYCFYSSDTEALEACFRLLHDDDDDDKEHVSRVLTSDSPHVMFKVNAINASCPVSVKQALRNILFLYVNHSS